MSCAQDAAGEPAFVGLYFLSKGGCGGRAGSSRFDIELNPLDIMITGPSSVNAYRSISLLYKRRAPYKNTPRTKFVPEHAAAVVEERNAAVAVPSMLSMMAAASAGAGRRGEAAPCTFVLGKKEGTCLSRAFTPVEKQL